MSRDTSLDVDGVVMSSVTPNTGISPTAPGPLASHASTRVEASVGNVEDNMSASERHLEQNRQQGSVKHTHDIPSSVFPSTQPPWAVQRRGPQFVDPMELPPMPPIPDLRFEQSYLNSIADASSWKTIAWITFRDQVRFLFLHFLSVTDW